MAIAVEVASFRRKLLRWYQNHRRDLPWRGTRNPYRVWVSEVMLQQTRVAVVQERYPQFLARFPTLNKLSRARLSSVLAAWSGLGYYRRARALHRASRIVVHEHRGSLPARAELLRNLPGIGRYTAAAIASIAFGKPEAVVDGNVERILGRLHGNSLKDPWARADEILDRKNPGNFNQAMMELGATVCLPHQPLCGECPVREFCRTQGKLAQTQKMVRQKRQVNYALLRNDSKVYLVKRDRKASLMAEMWELPEVRNPPVHAPILRLRHSITNTDYDVRVFATEDASKHTSARWVPMSQAERLPLTGLTRKILRQL